MTMSIASQVMRAWGDGWEKTVLPLLIEQQQQQSDTGTMSVEGRIIGAGLKSLKGADAEEVQQLFSIFAVTQEDFVHPMAVVELISSVTSQSQEQMWRLSLGATPSSYR